MVILKKEGGIDISGKFNQAEYDKANTTRYQLKLNNVTDADIIQKLSSVKSKQGYIKDCIRKDLKHSK